jgi:S-adenosylmethionine decarboxylase
MAEKSSLARLEAFADAETHTAKDYLVHKDGRVYAGTHVLIDFWGATNLNDPELIERSLREAAEECGATVLHTHVHEFSANGGVSGVAVLAESHISVHTWPELGFAAFDVFMCGNCEPNRALPVLRRVFRPDREQIDEQNRGIIE